MSTTFEKTTTRSAQIKKLAADVLQFLGRDTEDNWTELWVAMRGDEFEDGRVIKPFTD